MGSSLATITRLGRLEAENQYKYISTDTTTVCKYGAGRLENLIVTDPSGTVTIYDNSNFSDTRNITFNLPFKKTYTNLCIAFSSCFNLPLLLSFPVGSASFDSITSQFGSSIRGQSTGVNSGKRCPTFINV